LKRDKIVYLGFTKVRYKGRDYTLSKKEITFLLQLFPDCLAQSYIRINHLK